MRRRRTYWGYRERKQHRRKIFFTILLFFAAAALLLALFYFLRKPKEAGITVEETFTSEEPASTAETTTEAPEPATEAEAEKISLEEYWANDPRTPVEVKGIYLTGPIAGTVNTLDELISLVENTELNAMVIDIKTDNGEITYNMNQETVQAIGAAVPYIPDMPGLIARLKEKNIYLIARIPAFRDPILAERMPEYGIHNPDGSLFYDRDGLAWVNPYQRGVWDYLIAISQEAAALGFDEIQFDYVRFSTDPALAEADFGPEAEGVSRTEIITAFVRYACEELVPLGVFVSADVYGTILNNPADGEIVGQNYQAMAAYLDYICPMVYPSHYNDGVYQLEHPDMAPYELIFAAMSDSQNLLNTQATVGHTALPRPWLQAFTATWLENHIPYTGVEIRHQINGVYDSGSTEWILWNGSSQYTADGLNGP